MIRKIVLHNSFQNMEKNCESLPVTFLQIIWTFPLQNCWTFPVGQWDLMWSSHFRLNGIYNGEVSEPDGCVLRCAMSQWLQTIQWEWRLWTQTHAISDKDLSCAGFKLVKMENKLTKVAVISDSRIGCHVHLTESKHVFL